MRLPKAKRPLCKTCHGAGRVNTVIAPGTLLGSNTYRWDTCPICEGTGRRSHAQQQHHMSRSK